MGFGGPNLGLETDMWFRASGQDLGFGVWGWV